MYKTKFENVSIWILCAYFGMVARNEIVTAAGDEPRWDKTCLA